MSQRKWIVCHRNNTNKDLVLINVSGARTVSPNLNIDGSVGSLIDWDGDYWIEITEEPHKVHELINEASHE